MAGNPYPAGIGNAQQAMQATAAMRNEPWYQQLLRSWGLDPKGDANGNVRLTDDQQNQLLEQAQAHGIGVSDKYQIDENGQIAEKPGHLWRNIAIGAGIGGLALTGLGAAGIGPLSGLFGGAGAASAASPFAAGLAPGVTLPGAMAALPAVGGTVAGGAASTLGAVAGALKGGSTLGKIASLLPAVGQSVGAADQASGQNNLNQEELALRANEQNTSGVQSDTNNQIAVSKQNEALRNAALRKKFSLSVAGAPPVGPMGVKGGINYSPAFMDALAAEANAPTQSIKAPTPYTPINIKDVQGATNTKPGTLSQIGQWLAPSATIASKVLPLFAH